MLKQRVITALALLAVLLPALLLPLDWPFALLTVVMVAAAGWEWGRLNGLSGSGSLLLGALVAVACGLSWFSGFSSASLSPLWWAGLAVWVGFGALSLRRGPAAWPALPVAVRIALGFVVLWLAWLALIQARTAGIGFLLSVFCLVWAADIGAYFGGRAFGRRKLAPSISPGKSWEGVWSGMAAVLLLAIGWSLLDRGTQGQGGSFFSLMQQGWGWLGLVLASLLLSAMSVVGDLFESLVKRSAGAKDSSQLLPGHGGVLDRIDALLPVFPMALALSGL